MGYTIEVQDHNFEQEVLEKSYQKPVIVDFFATWCGPCHMLSPILEKIASEYDCVVAKLNTEENPYISQAFKVEAIPDVKIIAEGRIIDGFVGVLPEPEIRQLLAKCGIKSTLEDSLTDIQQQIAAGDAATASEMLASLLSTYPDNRRVALTAAKFYLAADQMTKADDLISSIQADEREFYAEAQAVKALIKLKLESSLPAENDLDKAFAKAASLTVAGNYGEALPLFLDIIMEDKKYKDEAPRKAMISIFNLLGDTHPLTKEYRRKLTTALY